MGDTLSVAAAVFLAALVAVTLPSTASRSAPQSQPISMTGLIEPIPAVHKATPATARDMVPATTGNAALSGGGCGEREIRVFDPAAGEYRMRTASVCWRNIL